MPKRENLHSQLMTMTCLKSALKVKVGDMYMLAEK